MEDTIISYLLHIVEYQLTFKGRNFWHLLQPWRHAAKWNETAKGQIGMVPLIWSIQNSQIHKNRRKDRGFHGKGVHK